MTSGVQKLRVRLSAVCWSYPRAMTAAYRLPPLHPTATETSIPSRCNTRHTPRAAAHLTAPDPMTRATRLLLCISVFSISTPLNLCFTVAADCCSHLRVHLE